MNSESDRIFEESQKRCDRIFEESQKRSDRALAEYRERCRIISDEERAASLKSRELSRKQAFWEAMTSACLLLAAVFAVSGLWMLLR